MLSEISDSNRPPSPWQGDALPIELLPHIICFPIRGQRRIRTSVGVLQQIYSLPRLTTSVSAQILNSKSNFKNFFSNFRKRITKLNTIFFISKLFLKNVYIFLLPFNQAHIYHLYSYLHSVCCCTFS